MVGPTLDFGLSGSTKSGGPSVFGIKRDIKEIDIGLQASFALYFRSTGR